MASGGWAVPESIRDEFKAPIGSLIDENDLRTYESPIVVGDVVSLAARKAGITPRLSVYDGRTERKEMTDFARLVRDEGLDETAVDNPPGKITRKMADAVRNALEGKAPAIIRVEGEEDLALMPCILFAPIGTVIVYGWPGEGMMAVTTDAAIKEKIRKLWNKMEEYE